MKSIKSISSPRISNGILKPWPKKIIAPNMNRRMPASNFDSFFFETGRLCWDRLLVFVFLFITSKLMFLRSCKNAIAWTIVIELTFFKKDRIHEKNNFNHAHIASALVPVCKKIKCSDACFQLTIYLLEDAMKMELKATLIYFSTAFVILFLFIKRRIPIGIIALKCKRYSIIWNWLIGFPDSLTWAKSL